ncbi:putative NBD/HSP70 family sugar kinase [Kribbella aluminosa]|uniref:NBD/HSP70 family sugar kinase n=1 Tax=Kribbella aluminosa TaxID=416017 RepID=A0ABS4UWN6_9ACTN|nr:ROK family transcriptional regulator [Kribbella aluminosa]MBP2356042.1 putative NBD/HSP70 family sugar kinase [Kribbella aluminosa]
MRAKSFGDLASRASCLTALRTLGAGTVSEIAEAAGTSRQTVDVALARLAEMGLAEYRVDSVLPHEGGGRPARVSRFRADAGYVVGVDLIGTTVKVALADLAGRWVRVGSLRPPTPTSDRPALDPVVAAVRDVVDEAGVDRSLLRAVGVGTSGVPSPDGSMLTSPLIKPWTEGNVGRQLSDLLGVPVVLDNDLTLGAIAESRLGALRGAATAVFAETFYNLSARILIDGAVVRGRSGVAGEFGVLKAFGRRRSRLETYFSDVGRMDEVLHRLADGSDEPADTAELDELVEAMAAPLAGLVLAVDPDVIALGGRLGRYASVLAKPLRAALRDAIEGGPPVDPRIVGAEFVTEGVLVGAIDQAFARFPDRIYGLDSIQPPTQLLPAEAAFAV